MMAVYPSQSFVRDFVIYELPFLFELDESFLVDDELSRPPLLVEAGEVAPGGEAAPPPPLPTIEYWALPLPMPKTFKRLK